MLIQLSLVLAAATFLAAQSDEQILKSQRAKELMAAGQFVEAIPLYQELVQAMPGNPGLLLNLGMAQHMAGQDRAAIEQFERVLKVEPRTFPALAMMGASWMRLGQPVSAIPHLRQAGRLQPKNSGVRKMLGDALFALRQHLEAVAQYRELTSLEPQNSHAWYGLGRSYEALAQNAFAQLASAAPGSAWWLVLIAESRVREKQNSSAFYFYRQALAKNPRLRGAHGALARIYQDAGHPDWAATEERSEQALGRPDCRTSAAECHFHAGRYEDVITATLLAKTPEAQYWRTKACNALAFQAFESLANIGPSVPLHRFQAEQYRNQGRYADAIQELQKALALQPGDPLIEQDIATSVYLSRDYAAAEPLLRKLLERQPKVADLHFLLGDTLLQLQRFDEGISELRQALQFDPSLLPAHGALGRALVQTGQAAQAIPHLKKSLNIDDDGSLHYQLMRAAQAAGETALAAQSLKKYQQIQKASEAAKEQLKEEARITAPEPQ